MYLEITICDIQSVSSEVTICVLKIYLSRSQFGTLKEFRPIHITLSLLHYPPLF